MKFKLLVGEHCQNERDHLTNEMIVYKVGDVFVSAEDLVKKFNSPGSIKFEHMSDDARVTKGPKTPQSAVAKAAADGFNTLTSDSAFKLEDLEKMDVAALLQLAADEEINVGNTKDKKKLIDIIKQGLTATANA